MKSFGHCTCQSCTTSSSNPKWHPHRVSFKGHKGWKLLGTKSGEYGRWGNTSDFKSWICFTAWRAAWGRALSCHRHTRIQCTLFPLPIFFFFFPLIALLSWFWNISPYFWKILYNFCGFHLNDLCIRFVIQFHAMLLV